MKNIAEKIVDVILVEYVLNIRDRYEQNIYNIDIDQMLFYDVSSYINNIRINDADSHIDAKIVWNLE